MGKYDYIINKAKELSAIIENHEITVRYRNSLEKIKNDTHAQRILTDLIRIGGELKEQNSTGESSTGRAELEILKEDFEKNSIVRDHILVQREYLDLIKSVQERIKNPRK